MLCPGSFLLLILCAKKTGKSCFPGAPNLNRKYSLSTASSNGTSALTPQSLFCRFCAHLLSGAVADWPHESWDRCQHLQILYHVWPPGGLRAFCSKYEPRCCSVVQQAPPNVCECAEGSSPHRGSLTPWVGEWAKALSFHKACCQQEMVT